MLLGHTVEILSLERGESLGRPMALLTIRPEINLKSVLLLFTPEQCVRIRDSLDKFLNDPESWLYLPAEEQAECFMGGEDMTVSEILELYAETPQLFDEDDELVDELARHKDEIAHLFAEGDVVAAGALARIDPSQPDLLPVLSASQDRKAFSGFCLGFLGPPAVPILINLLKDENIVVVCNAARALGRIGLAENVPALIELLDGESALATEAAGALGEIGSHDALPMLWDCLRGESPLRLAAAEAIWRISSDPTAAVAVATEMLGSEEEYLVANACRLFADIGPAARAAAPDLQRLLGHSDRCVRQEAAKALLRCWCE